MTKSARAAFSVGRHLRGQALACLRLADSPRSSSRASCVAGEQTVATTRSKSLCPAGFVQQRDVHDRDRATARSARTRAGRRRSRGRPPDARLPRGRAAPPRRRTRSGRASADRRAPSASSTSAPNLRGDRLRRLGSGAVTPCASSSASRQADAERGSARAHSSCRWRCRRSAQLSTLRQLAAWAGRCMPAACYPSILALRALGGGQRVLQQHRDRQRADAARARASARRPPVRPPDARRRRPASRGARTPRAASSPAGTARSTVARSSTCVVPTSITVAPGLTNSA